MRANQLKLSESSLLVILGSDHLGKHFRIMHLKGSAVGIPRDNVSKVLRFGIRKHLEELERKGNRLGGTQIIHHHSILSLPETQRSKTTQCLEKLLGSPKKKSKIEELKVQNIKCARMTVINKSFQCTTSTTKLVHEECTYHKPPAQSWEHKTRLDREPVKAQPRKKQSQDRYTCDH